MLILCHRKRQAEDPADTSTESDSKRPRLGEEEAGDIAVEEFAEDVPDTPHTAQAAAIELASAKGKDKVPLTETGGTFKENPFTFLSPDDPAVTACM
jgi:multisite-specific tRNA:(cytosine-C5)-methyltransferase